MISHIITVELFSTKSFSSEPYFIKTAIRSWLQPLSLWYFPFKDREHLATIILILHQESVVELCSQLVMSMSSESIPDQIPADLTAVSKAIATCTNQLFSINPNTKSNMSQPLLYSRQNIQCNQ